MKIEYEAYLVKITGRVTGVGFRYSTRDFVNQFSEIKDMCAISAMEK